MKRLVIAFIILSLFAFYFVSGAEDTKSDTSKATTVTVPEVSQDVPTKGYACLEAKIKNQSSFSLEQAIFGAIALGYQKPLIDKIGAEKRSNDVCWPASSCDVKTTAQVALAYSRAGQANENIISWLEARKGGAVGLTWYLEIDITDHTPSTCTVSYDSTQKEISILGDMKIGSGASTGCFTPSVSGYWLRISDSCLDKKFTVSCKKDFVTTLLYEKVGGIVYISSETHNAGADATTTEQVNAKCFKNAQGCDYEGSLWAALVLTHLKKDINDVVPYLRAMAEDSPQYFPSSFLYFVVPTQDQYGEIVQRQHSSKFWEIIGSPYKKFYDTSLAILALDRSSNPRTEVAQAKKYLEGAQSKDGCWNARDNIVDTSFILFSGWPRAAAQGGGGGGGGSLCSAVSGASCETDKSACISAGGKELSNQCLKAREFCCSVKVPTQSCTGAKGFNCKENEECLGTRLDISNSGICCSIECSPKVERETCPSSGELKGTCRSGCGDNEEQSSQFTCSGGTVCCLEKGKAGPGANWFLIIILILLIILVIVAIVYRDKIRVAWFSWRHGVKTSPVTRGPPPAPVMATRPGPRPPGYPRPMARPPFRPRTVEKDKEMEETFKKLKEMGSS
ncbi:hypothetical protein FJZ18_03175 [Candidatus Pacearchaeota archaeon]|nr:hypothetical protein [Candidatus Pacearchaeota archaeon]